MNSCTQWRPVAVMIFCAAILSIVMFDTSNGTAAAQALFVPATPADIVTAARAAAPKGIKAKRERLVRVDATVLSRHLAPAGADRAADRDARAQKLDGIVRLDLFPDASGTFRRTGVQKSDAGGYIWEGSASNIDLQEALLVINKGTVSGRVQLNDQLFKITHVSGDVHRITELDAGAFPPEAPPAIPNITVPPSPPRAVAPDAGEDRDASDRAKAKTIIRVLVVYTRNAQIQAGGNAILTEINQAMGLANQALTRAGINAAFQLAGTPVRVVYAENANIQEDLENLSGLNTPTNAAAFNAVRNLRTQRKADLVSLFRRNDPSFCGIAWFPGSSPNAGQPMPSAATRPTGYSVMNWTCVDNLSFHHEMGHNMGVRHDRYVDPTTPGYNHGFVHFGKRMRTIMAYNNYCSDRGVFCTRINYFSAPKTLSGGVVIGNASNNNARRLKETYIAISKYLN